MKEILGKKTIRELLISPEKHGVGIHSKLSAPCTFDKDEKLRHKKGRCPSDLKAGFDLLGSVHFSQTTGGTP